MIKSPFPYFGGKSRAASLVWPRFGDVQNYVEPFFGSGAMLLARPDPFHGTETVNDADGLLSNFWRAIKADPEKVATFADWPVNENDLHARHSWLVERKDSLQAWLEGDPDFYDAKIAGWWVWGMACWIAGRFCSGKGPWHRTQDEDGNWVLSKDAGDAGRGVKRQRISLNSGRGVNRTSLASLVDYFAELSDRFALVRVCCGDWKRVCGPVPTFGQGLTAVFLDPPYADTANRDSDLYRIDSESVAHAVRDWAVDQGDNPLMRIALCGYEGEHKMPGDWKCVSWKDKGGYASQNRTAGGYSVNSHRERIWFSPHCLSAPVTVSPIRTAQQSMTFA
jgi:hypothetical protein